MILWLEIKRCLFGLRPSLRLDLDVELFALCQHVHVQLREAKAVQEVLQPDSPLEPKLEVHRVGHQDRPRSLSFLRDSRDGLLRCPHAEQLRADAHWIHNDESIVAKVADQPILQAFEGVKCESDHFSLGPCEGANMNDSVAGPLYPLRRRPWHIWEDHPDEVEAREDLWDDRHW